MNRENRKTYYTKAKAEGSAVVEFKIDWKHVPDNGFTWQMLGNMSDAQANCLYRAVLIIQKGLGDKLNLDEVEGYAKAD